jgi:hypothetical protein
MTSQVDSVRIMSGDKEVCPGCVGYYAAVQWLLPEGHWEDQRELLAVLRLKDIPRVPFVAHVTEALRRASLEVVNEYTEYSGSVVSITREPHFSVRLGGGQVVFRLTGADVVSRYLSEMPDSVAFTQFFDESSAIFECKAAIRYVPR